MDDDYRAALLQVIGRDSTISGRTFLWSTIMTSIMKHPWLGYGFGSFWQGTKGPSVVILNAVHWDVAHAHNGFLDLWIDMGFLGLTVFLIGYGISCYRAFHVFRKSDEQETVWPLVFLAFLLVFNFTESAILRQNNLFLALYVAVYAQTAIQYRAVQSTEDDGLESQGTLPSLAMDAEPAS
jgi:O-antigen ligase